MGRTPAPTSRHSGAPLGERRAVQRPGNGRQLLLDAARQGDDLLMPEGRPLPASGHCLRAIQVPLHVRSKLIVLAVALVERVKARSVALSLALTIAERSRQNYARRIAA